VLPDHLPAFVRSPAYFFGVISLSSLVLLILSGILLAAFGPQWWHDNAVGHFVNSLHFWCAELFFFSMLLHLWLAFYKGAWRHGRRLTWVSGMFAFLAAISTAFTSYLSMTNFSAQWIAAQGKDALNSVGIGAFFNLLNFGQIYGFHIVLLPLLLVLLIGIHLLQVRIRGIVRPYAPTLEEERAREALWGGGWGGGAKRTRRLQPRHVHDPPTRPATIAGCA
jgi:quinol-cytochrome oxidoreductase complex cytochrome b subunit